MDYDRLSEDQSAQCSSCGLGPGLESGPSLEKRGPPRGLSVVCGCWS